MVGREVYGDGPLILVVTCVSPLQAREKLPFGPIRSEYSERLLELADSRLLVLYLREGGGAQCSADQYQLGLLPRL